MKEDFIERPYFSFTPAKGIREQVSCPSCRQSFGEIWSMRGSQRLVRRTATLPFRFFAHNKSGFFWNIRCTPTISAVNQLS